MGVPATGLPGASSSSWARTPALLTSRSRATGCLLLELRGGDAAHRPRRDGARAVLQEGPVHDEPAGQAVDLEALEHGVVEVAVLDGRRLVRRAPGFAPAVAVHASARGVQVEVEGDLLATLGSLLDASGELAADAGDGGLDAHEAVPSRRMRSCVSTPAP